MRLQLHYVQAGGVIHSLRIKPKQFGRRVGLQPIALVQQLCSAPMADMCQPLLCFY